MLKLCDDIDTLAMMLCDGELAAQEQRDVELHLLECSACRAHVDRERVVLGELRQRLAPPPAPALLRARIGRALDEVDRARRPTWRSWALPAAAATAAAAALAVFVLSGDGDRPATATDRPRKLVASDDPRTAPVSSGRGFGDGGSMSDVVFRLAGSESYGPDAAALHYDVYAPDGRRFDLRVVLHGADALEVDPSARRIVGGYEVWDGAVAEAGLVVRDGARAVRMSSTTMTVADLKLLIGGTPIVARIGAEDPRR